MNKKQPNGGVAGSARADAASSTALVDPPRAPRIGDMGLVAYRHRALVFPAIVVRFVPPVAQKDGQGSSDQPAEQPRVDVILFEEGGVPSPTSVPVALDVTPGCWSPVVGTDPRSLGSIVTVERRDTDLERMHGGAKHDRAAIITSIRPDGTSIIEFHPSGGYWPQRLYGVDVTSLRVPKARGVGSIVWLLTYLGNGRRCLPAIVTDLYAGTDEVNVLGFTPGDGFVPRRRISWLPNTGEEPPAGEWISPIEDNR